ncbi:DUF962 domain-containing protein [Tautonia plasticadhaerens]|uniref:DUF962 domain-containing protein n=1 Tax=Tautonia plasticadhaerens TaxID=2527974 RepID=A0A518GY41_9BACT|nr:DUF962 domain-containing protein [Tautonia plasticadhaerens]QDV33483.1 hypothetical protein ElP_13560 [Tautonia plasticadhaerens]
MSLPRFMPSASGPPRLSRFVEKYLEDHSHPVNHLLHVGVGWPMVAAAVLLLPFKPLWSIGLVLGGYAFMFAGHFLFERNRPTILSRPSTPFVIAWAVLRDIGLGLARVVTGRRAG